jgi:hypothetical protein
MAGEPRGNASILGMKIDDIVCYFDDALISAQAVV